MTINKKKLTKRVKSVIKMDVISSVAVVSVLVNLFFFSGVVLFNSTNQLDSSLYNAAVSNLCIENYQENLLKEMNGAANKALAKANFEIQCRSGEFSTYYDNALEAFLSNSL